MGKALRKPLVNSEDYTLVCRLLLACHRAHDATTEGERAVAFDLAKSYVRDLAIAWGVAVDW